MEPPATATSREASRVAVPSGIVRVRRFAPRLVVIAGLLVGAFHVHGAVPAVAQETRLSDDCPGGATLEDLLRSFAYRSSGRDSAWDALMDTGRVRMIPAGTVGRLVHVRSLSPLGVFAHVRPVEPVRGLSDFWTVRGCVEVTGGAVAIRFVGPYGFPERAGGFEIAGLKLYPDPRLGALGRYRNDDGRSIDAYLYPADADAEGRRELLEWELRKARQGIASYYEVRDTTHQAGEWGAVSDFSVSDSTGTIRGRRARLVLRATSGPHAGEALRSFLYVFIRGQTVLKVRASYPDTLPATERETVDAAVRDFVRLAERMDSYRPPDVQISRRDVGPTRCCPATREQSLPEQPRE